ncbi:MAG: DUF2842 domain-containing protein, partial [Pseudomonadota bacterium]
PQTHSASNSIRTKLATTRLCPRRIFGTYLATAPKWLTLIFFVIAGIGWAVPLKPVFGWMNSGPEDEQP